LTKENVLLFTVLFLMAIFPNNGLAQKTIKTTQYTIVIDPGHGGKDNGIVSPKGLKEKNFTLSLARKIARQLETRYNVLLTRTSDMDSSQRDRIFIANSNHADFFLSIHLHQSSQASVFFYYFNPPEPYKPSTTGSENTWKLQPLAHQSKSKQAVNSFLHIFSASPKPVRIFSKGAPIKILEGTTMPAILMEPLSFSTLPLDSGQMDSVLDENARLISKSIDHYFSSI